MRREAAIAVLTGVMTLGAACAGDTAMSPGADTLAVDGSKGGGGTGGGTGGGGTVGSRLVFPADNPWNTDVSASSVDPN